MRSPVVREPELPAMREGWKVSRLEVLAETNPETLAAATPLGFAFRYIDLSAVERGLIDWSRVRETTFRYAPSRARRAVRPEDVLFGTVRPSLQSHGAIPREEAGPLVASTGFAVIRARNGESDCRFLFHTVMSDLFAVQARRTEVGSNYPAVNESDVRDFLVPHPDAPEQVRIAAALDALDEGIRRTEQVIAKLKQMKQGLLHDLLTRGVDAHGTLRPTLAEAPDLYTESPLGQIPRTWTVERLLDRVTIPNGQLDPRLEPFRSMILVAPDHIEPGTGRLLEQVTAAAQGAISGKYGFAPDDVVYSKIRPYLRKAIRATFEGLCSADMYPLRPGPEVNPRFLLALILGESFSRFAESVSMRSGFPKINRTELAEYRTALPSREEQDRTATVIAAQEERLSFEESGLMKLRALKLGLRHDLLTGRVRVSDTMVESA